MPDFLISIINLDDTKDEYNVNPFLTVEYLKRLIYERKHISEFKLAKGRIFLEDEKSLQDYDITPDDKLIMVPYSHIIKPISNERMMPQMRILPIMTRSPISK